MQTRASGASAAVVSGRRFSVSFLINNYTNGVLACDVLLLQGFRYKMRLVHAHFPINVVVPKDGSSITVKNFLGGKQDKFIAMKNGCTVKVSADVKGELIFDGNDNRTLSMLCSQVKQVCRVGRKDERKFLDGIFVSQKTLVEPKEDAE